MYEVTFIGNGKHKTVTWTLDQCIKHFGQDEWPEYRDGYLTNVVVIEL